MLLDSRLKPPRSSGPDAPQWRRLTSEAVANSTGSSATSLRPSPISSRISSSDNTRRRKRKRSVTAPSSQGGGGGLTEADIIRQKLPPERRLRALKVKSPTLLRYHRSVVDFEQWCQQRRFRLGSPAQVDSALCKYFIELKDDSRPLSDASYTVLVGYYSSQKPPFLRSSSLFWLRVPLQTGVRDAREAHELGPDLVGSTSVPRSSVHWAE